MGKHPLVIAVVRNVEKTIVSFEDFVKLIQSLAGRVGAKRPQEVGVGNYEERWRDPLGNEHVVTVLWVTWPKHPLLDKPPELKEYVGEVIISHKIVSGVSGVFTEYSAVAKRKIKFETVELGKKIKILGIE